MLSKSLSRIFQTMKSSRVRSAAIFASLVLVLIIGAVQASGPMRPPHPPHPPRPPQQGGMWGMQMPNWRPWMPWMQTGPVPKLKILLVVEDVGVAVETQDFPENEDFTVTMGKIYTRGVNGIEVGSFNSGDGSTQYLVFTTPAELYGKDRISIRAQTDHQHPYFAYNWFYNTTAIAPGLDATAVTSIEELQAVAAELTAALPEADTAEEVPAEAESSDETAAETESADTGVGGAESDQAAVAEDDAAGSELTGVVWQWTALSDPVQGDLAIDAPEQYTIQFMPEGLVGIKADCNNGNGTYIVDDEGGIDIAIGPVTLALCAPESLSDQFLQHIDEVAAYSVDAGVLLLDLPADGGTLSFAAEGVVEDAAEGEAEAPAAGEEVEAAEESGAAASVTGTVTYVQRIALPDDAVVNVQIQDTSLADAPAVVMGEQIIETAGQQVPIPYEVAYNPDEIQDNHTYTVRARIEDNEGNLLFTSDTAIPVITRDNPTEDVEIMTVPVSSPEAEAPAEGEEAEAPAEGEEAEAPAEGEEAEAPAEGEEAEAPAEGDAETEEETSLTGVVWNWTEFSDAVQGVLPIENPEQYTVEFLEDGTVGIKADCNNGSGSYVVDEEGGIDITVGAVTLAMCAEDSLHDQFLQYLDAATIYFFDGGDLLLDLPVDSGTLRFAAAEEVEAQATAKLAAISAAAPVQAAASSGGENGEEMEESTVPSFKICTVVRDTTVSVVTENFPADQEFAVKMGPAPAYNPMPMHPRPMHPKPMPPKPMPYQKQGPMNPHMQNMGAPMAHPGGMWMKPVQKVWIPYYEAGTLETGEGGQLEATFEIPAELAGTYKISIMMRTAHQYPYLSYNWFYNNDAAVCNGDETADNDA